jgi:hypothetical protein
MRTPRFRVRTLMLAVGVTALLVWGAMMGTRSYDSYRLAREYSTRERGWREIAARRLQLKDDPGGEEFRSQCVQYFARLAAKYRRAMWRPWMPVAPDPHAPGYDLWVEQERRAKEAVPDPTAPGSHRLQRP